MSERQDAIFQRRDAITLPSIRWALAVSLLLHVLVLGKWLPQLRLPTPDELASRQDSGRSLVVNLVPPSSPAARAPSPDIEARPAPAAPVPRPRAAARPQPAPRVMAMEKPAPAAVPPPREVAPPAPAQPAAGTDLTSYIEARRRARAESEPAAPPRAPAPAGAPAEDENARANRAVAANLGLGRAPSYGPDPTRNGGGIFQMKRLGYTDAEFYFYGWNKDIRRNTTQLIEVSRGDAGDIRVAVVRRMIAIIREHETEDFMWESLRLGRTVRLSARKQDSAGLEEFMILEFFSGARAAP